MDRPLKCWNKYILSRQENYKKMLLYSYYFIYAANTETFIEKTIYIEQEDFVINILLPTG